MLHYFQENLFALYGTPTEYLANHCGHINSPFLNIVDGLCMSMGINWYYL